jgi:AsmA protein
MSDLFAPRDRLVLHDRSPRRRRRGLGGFLVLLMLACLIGGGAWIALTGPFSPARLKAELERGVTRATGRQFTIAGPLHVSLGMSPSITAEGISLANVPGGSRPDMLQAASLQAQIALLPLLAGDIVIDLVTIEQPDIILETAADGTPNWQMHRPHRAAFEGAPDESASPHEGGSALDIHRIHLNGGTITYRPIVGPAVTAQIDHLVLAADGIDLPMRGKLEARANGVPFTGTLSAGSFSRLQGGPLTVMAGAWPLTITLTGPGASLKIDGGVNHPDEMRGFGFLVTGNVQDMVPLYPWLPKPAQLPLHDVNLTTRLSDSAGGDRVTSGLSLHAGESDLSAAVPGLMLKDALLSAPGPGQQMQLTVDGVFQGAPLRVSGTATQPDTLSATGTAAVPVPLAVSVQAASASLSVRGTVPASWNGLGYDLQVNVKAPNLADLSPLARRTLPDIKDLVFDSHVGDAGFRLRGFTLSDMVLSSSLGDLSGSVTAAWSPVPTLSGTLNAKHFDLDGALAALSSFDATVAGAPASGGTPALPPLLPGAPVPDAADAGTHVIPDSKLPFAALHGADADLTLSAASLTVAGDTYHDLQAHLLANSGKVVLNPFRVTAPQGIMIGALTLDAGADPPPVALTLRAPSMSAAKLAALLGFPGGASGQVQVDAQLSGTGDTPHALAASASGHIGLTMVNGQFTDALFQNAVGAALETAGVPPLSGSTDVRCLALRARLSHGAGSVEALALDTSRLSMTGSGSFDLGAETVALHLKPTLRIGGAGVAAPVSLTGGFTSLKASADAAMEGGRFGLTIGGPAPNDSACVAALPLARGGMAGPMPSAAPAQNSGPHKKPIDLLRGLFH